MNTNGATADVLIIGAGIMGASAALHLARRGLRVAVLEKSHPGAGSTGKSSAVIRQHYSNELTARLALHSLRVFQNFAEEVGGEAGFTPAGFLLLAAGRDRAGLQANVAFQQELGIRSEVISDEALRELLPGMAVERDLAAAYEPEGGYADPNLTLNSLVAAARARGARFHPQTEVTGVVFAGGRVAGVQSTQGNFSAPLVVNCAGPWGARVGRMAGVSLPIDPCRVQVAFYRPPAGRAAAYPVVGDFVNAIYFRPETGGLTLVGRIDPAEAEAVVDPDGYNERADLDFVYDAGERLARRAPFMQEGQYTGGYAALYAITPDWHPIVDETPAGSGFFVCAGFSGHGFKLGPAVGLLVADLVTGNSAPAFDAGLFRLSRYAEGDPVRGKYEYGIAG